ncbi:hypothetical protein LAW45_22620 [Escherichia coli]|nr:hypothetical protein [Escherichia coli]MDD9005273.1 hypothetical protein [Escherichia coli]MDD9015391.1 hypothetical protein [Escherichia coli]MDD9027789.1 hypothetical protein [Escherichia coli]MDD9032459.1 hypothetical protein [Escherichia coli]
MSPVQDVSPEILIHRQGTVIGFNQPQYQVQFEQNVTVVFVRTGREAGVLIIAELFSEVVTVSQPVPGEQETDITDGIRLSDWYYKYKKSSESNVKDLPE